MSRSVTYGDHQIRAGAIPAQGAWEDARAAQAVIRVPAPGRAAREQAVRGPDDRTFPTQEDAEGDAVHPGIRWVERPGR